MSQGDKSKQSLISTIDRILEIYKSLTEKEIGQHTLSEVKLDLIDLREALSELNPALISYAFDHKFNSSDAASLLMVTLTRIANSMTSSSDQVTQSISLLNLAEIDNKSDVVDSRGNNMATLTTNSLSRNGLIESLKSLRQLTSRL